VKRLTEGDLEAARYASRDTRDEGGGGNGMDIYCGQLGMVIDVSYCLTVNKGMPCRNVVCCWEDRVEIRRVLKALYTEDELIAGLAGPPQSRMGRILSALAAIDKEAQHAVR
jgi:hypothetical protein